MLYYFFFPDALSKKTAQWLDNNNNNNKIKIDQEEIRLGYFRFYGDNVRSWVMLWGEMFPCVSEMCFKKHNIIVFIQGSSLLIYNTGYYDT